MLYIRIEIWPFGNRDKARVLGEATIANVGGDNNMANYEALISKFGGFKVKKNCAYPERDRVAFPLASSTWKKTEIENFPRLKKGPWDLLYLVLYSVVGKRNKIKLTENT
jgi:hypothetical protein